MGTWVRAVLILGASTLVDFKPPDAAARREALGSLDGLSEPLRRALDPKGFEPIPAPGPSDWLASHEEEGQSYQEFLGSGALRPDEVRKKIYLQPLGAFERGASPSLEKLRAYAAAYFMLEVETLPLLELKGLRLTTRKNPRAGNVQVLTGDVLSLLREKLPADAFCLLAVTMVDLYPEDSWNFVFGQALLRGRVGVFSFARYDPAFLGGEAVPDREKVILKRSAKVLVHETAHMFGVTHCTFYRCVLNGSNHLDESDSRPLHLCPVDLRKLQRSIGFDAVERDRRLLRFYRREGFIEEAGWTQERLRAQSSSP